MSEKTRCDVSIALRDLCIDMLRRHRAGESADAATILGWHESLVKAGLAHNALATNCEDIVEGGASPENLAAMQQALAHAMGQDVYWARADRW